MSCWKCGSGQHLYQISRYPASAGQIAGVGGNPDEQVNLEDISEADRQVIQMMSAEDRPAEERMTRTQAEELSAKMINLLQPYCDSIDVCGSFRRGREDPGDLDIVIIMKPRVTLPQIVGDLDGEYTAVNWLGEKKTQMVIEGVKVDVRTTTPRAKGAALLYFTGPAGYNIGIRRSAKSRGMKLNEYGIFDRETNEYLGGSTEEEIYEILGKNFRPATERKAENVSFATEENNEMQEAIIAGLRKLARDGYVVASAPYGNRSRNFYQHLSNEIMSELAELGSDLEGPEVTGTGVVTDPYDVVRSLARNEPISLSNDDYSVGIADMIESFTQQATLMDEQDGVGAPDGYTKMIFDLPYNGLITRRLAWKIAHTMGVYATTASDILYLYSTPQKNRNCSMITNMLLEELQPEVAGMSDSEQEQFYQEFGAELMRQVEFWNGPIEEEYVRNREWKIMTLGDTRITPAVEARDDIKDRAVTAAQRLNPFSAEEFREGGNWTPCYHCQTKIGDGEIIYGYKGSRVEAFCDSECIYDALYVEAEEVQEFNSVVMAPKGWKDAGPVGKTMMIEVMMQEARLQDALLELETNIRMGLISEKQAMTMFSKLLG